MTAALAFMAAFSIGHLADPTLAEPSTMSRFFYSGDGSLHLKNPKNGLAFKGVYRVGDRHYRAEAVEKISAVFGAPDQPSHPVVSLRLIEYLDYLEDRLRPGASITLTSGYRPPAYNSQLRAKGALAAKASLHQYGMAADFILEGVSSKRVWETVQAIGFGGTGYYHGRTVHVDVGPARAWDEKSSGVGTGLSDDNKLIGLVTDFDVYGPGDAMTLTFIRMTAFPINVRSAFSLLSEGSPAKKHAPLTFRPDKLQSGSAACSEFFDIDQMAALRWHLPPDLVPGRYRIEAHFCGGLWEAMPTFVRTPVFEIRRRP